MNVIKKQHMTIPWHSLVDQESDTPAIEASLEEKVTLIGRVGLAMLSAGTGAWRVRESMNRISACLGVTCDADIGHFIHYIYLYRGRTIYMQVSDPGHNRGQHR